MNLRLHQLEGFYYTGLAGGYARAAAAMPFPITEPAIYQQVRKLERALGQPLVAQAPPRRTVLTPAGRALHDFVAPFFRGLPAVLAGIRRGERARLVVAVEGTLGHDAAIPALAALRRRRPALEICLADRDAAEVARMVAAGEADAGLATLGQRAPPGLRQEPLFTLRLALCVPAAHPLARRRRAPAAADLDGLPICVYERGNPGRAILEDAYRRAGMTFHIAAEAGSAAALRALVAAGVAPAFVPVVAPTRGSAARREGSIVAFDVSAFVPRSLVPNEPVRYGLLTRPAPPAHMAVADLRRLLKQPVPAGDDCGRRAPMPRLAQER